MPWRNFYSRCVDNLVQCAKRAERSLLDAKFAEVANQATLNPPPGHLRIDPKSLQHVLIYKPDELGDAAQSLPALAELRSHLPHAKLYLICQEKTAPIFSRTGLVDEIAVLRVKTRFFRFRRSNGKQAVARFSVNHFDLAIFLRTYPAHFRDFLKLPARLHLHPLDPRMRSTSVYQVPISLWTSDRKHQALLMLQIISPLTGKSYDVKDIQYPRLNWEASDAKSHLTGRYLVVHPYANVETRRYPMEYWEQVISNLWTKFQIPIAVIGGAEDLPLAPAEGRMQLQGQLNIAQTAHLISKASAFLGNLSGPVHLASALGVPTITMMSGCSSIKEWGPLGHSLVLHAEVPCSPCERFTCPYQMRCVTPLTPERVMPAVERFLTRELGGESERRQRVVSLSKEHSPMSAPPV